MRLDGKVALVTGGASGVGREAALLFAKAGAKVVCADISDAGEAVVKEIEAAGGEAIYERVDVRELGELEAAVAAGESAFGHLDTVVANAGTVGGAAVARRLEDLSEDQWTSIIDINLVGTIRTFVAALPALRRAGGGAMTATASIAGLTGVAGQAAYSASKGGIIAVVRALAYELVSDRIRVNCVCPGGINTNLLAGTDILQMLTEQMQAAAAAETAPDPASLMNRAADPIEVANVHLFLASDAASLINGQPIVCDGGSSVANLWMVLDR